MTRGRLITGETRDEASRSFSGGLKLQTATLPQHYLYITCAESLFYRDQVKTCMAPFPRLHLMWPWWPGSARVTGGGF